MRSGRHDLAHVWQWRKTSVKRFPRGSEWRKWDLHVHAPETKLNDGYPYDDGQEVLDRFCQALHESDVQAFGITDYFSLDRFFAVKERYQALYPESDKVFFPNLELRLNEAVNQATEPVDFHIVFSPDLSGDKADEFLTYLKTQNTTQTGRQQSCADLGTSADYEKATVSRDGMQEAIKGTFGDKGDHTDHCLLISAVNNSGIRADRGSTRKKYLADEIDKECDGFFGSPANTEYFLDPKRLEEEDQTVAPKPVFAGCDAHSFDDLSAWLGCETGGSNAKHVTWIKADPTFEGLQQTLIEPSERVRLQATVPDKKEPYKVISRIAFRGSGDFPEEVVFNPGLNAIIGSRSSGKSALLAYVAHAVDPDYTVTRQVACGMEETDAGPGASVTWADVEHLDYSVEWAAGEAETGRVIYIPQNALYAISERPDEITAKIQPVVFRSDQEFKARYEQTMTDVDGLNESIREGVKKWFSLGDDFASLSEEIRYLGDRRAVDEQKKALKKRIERLQKSSSLTNEDVIKYQEVMTSIGSSEARLKEIAEEKRDLRPYVALSPDEKTYATTNRVAVRLTVEPASSSMPTGLKATLDTLIAQAEESTAAEVKVALVKYRHGLDEEEISTSATSERLREENKDLIEKSLANVQIAKLVKGLEVQEETLAEIDKKADLSKTKAEEQHKLREAIATKVSERDALLQELAEDFNSSGHMLEEMTFAIEADYDSEDISGISEGFNKHDKSPYIVEKVRLDIAEVLSDPGKFLEFMGSGKQKLNRGVNAAAQTSLVLTTTKDLRFVASLEGDRIGGFQKSSMTPGKQALFALTLILAETDEPWPLLVDQPEDDLDSRSVCDVIVKDLMRRKRERQILMVSHDANLVIGADSEEIIVANRHGDDRPNKDGRMFCYLTGSLEHSKPKDSKAKAVLDSCGIREHACEILDGGEEAFQKRKEKYRI